MLRRRSWLSDNFAYFAAGVIGLSRYGDRLDNKLVRHGGIDRNRCAVLAPGKSQSCAS
jgi:hypothetical protein